MIFRVSLLRQFASGRILLAKLPQAPTTDALIIVREIYRNGHDLAIRFTPSPVLLSSLQEGTGLGPHWKTPKDHLPPHTKGVHNIQEVVRPPFSNLWSSPYRGKEGALALLPETPPLRSQGGSYLDNDKRGVGTVDSAWCSCAALLYPLVPENATSVGVYNGHERTREEAQVLDAFVLGLKLSGTEDILRGVIGEHSYAQLVSPVLAFQAQVVSLFADHRDLVPYSLSRDPSNQSGLSEAYAHVWLAHTLLSADEENRVKWMCEEMDDSSACYARSPTLRSLLVLWYVASSSSTVGGEVADGLRPSCCPSASDVAQACQRMRDRYAEMTVCDLVALGMFGAVDSKVREEVLANFIERLHPSQVAPPSVDTRSNTSPKNDLERIIVVLFLLKYMGKQSGVGRVGTSMMSALDDEKNSSEVLFSLLDIATQISAYKEELTGKWNHHGNNQSLTTENDPSSSVHPSMTRDTNSEKNVSDNYQKTLICIMDYFLSRIKLAMSQCDIPSTSTHLYSVTLWLLRELPRSDACYRHFRRVVEHSQADAILLLEKAGLLDKSTLNLQSVVEVLLSLLEHCEREDLVNTVMQEVIISLEHRLRHDPTSFTQDDMKWLSMLGTSLFTKDENEAVIGSSFMDRGIREQMEELNVMDGSPWALCVATYRSLKEIVRALTHDQRSLRRQVQEQMRVIAKAAGRPQATPTQLITSQTQKSRHNSADFSSSSSVAKEKQIIQNEEGCGDASDHDKDNDAPKQRVLDISSSVRHRFLHFLEKLVKTLVYVRSGSTGQPIVVSSEMFDFVNQNVPVPNIQDEYRRKIFLLMNVTVDGKTMRERELKYKQSVGKKKKAKSPPEHAESEDGEPTEVIPVELRFLVNSLPLVLSPWASVMVLRDVLAESPGGNPRYTYVLNAAIDLQLPISTTRSRIATTLNMWRFLNTQTHKLSLKESVMVRQRCVLNLPLSYILSSYWSLLTWLVLTSLVVLNIVGLDVESQLVVNKLFQEFSPWDEIVMRESDPLYEEAATDTVSEYVNSFMPHHTLKSSVSLLSSDKILSSASYLFLGSPDQWRPMTIMPIGSDPRAKNEARASEEYACVMALLKKMSSSVVFPFYVDLPRMMPVKYVEAQVAERIRRVSLTNTWFLLRTLIRTFPLGREQIERTLISHTCAQANLIQRRITFLMYVQDGVPITEQFLVGLRGSLLSHNANLVVVVHESSLLKGGVTPERLHALTGDANVDVDMHKEKESHVGNGFERKKKGLQVLPCSRQLHKLRGGALRGGRNKNANLSLFATQFGLKIRQADSLARVERKTDDLQTGMVVETFWQRASIEAKRMIDLFRESSLGHAVLVSRDENIIEEYKSECTPVKTDPTSQLCVLRYLTLTKHLAWLIFHWVLARWREYLKQIQKPLFLVPQNRLFLYNGSIKSMKRMWCSSLSYP
ncbi:unnamed protein product [Phytomonas sp. Hart1]|nr:unnamed protein product [Phytomonas sp. Hart1]|eukprot:CCW67420.1 unnamed protein product [Phytomonas sp. isolate Hart1]